jgi:hypothetical protein
MDQAAAVAETELLLPGLVETMDPEHPGMHRTDTVDLIYVLSDACALELDGGEIVKLKEGDTIVLNGPRHARRNTHTASCSLLTVSLGVA